MLPPDPHDISDRCIRLRLKMLEDATKQDMRLLSLRTAQQNISQYPSIFAGDTGLPAMEIVPPIRGSR